MKRKTLALGALLALPFLAGGAGDAKLDRATLRGVASVNVVVDPLDPQILKEGVTQDGLESRLAEHLRNAKIEVKPSTPEFVAIRLTAVRAGRGPFAVSVTIGLYQPVTLVRDKNLKTATQTWEVETVLLAEPKLLRRACLDTLDELAGRFVSAYQSENPR